MVNTHFIMLIDDNEFDLFLNEKFIEAKKIAGKVSKYTDADEAYEYLYNSDAAYWPNVILLDIHMPVMNGFDFLRKYETLPAEKRQSTHVMMVTSSLDKQDIKNANENKSVLALLSKPLNVDEILDKLREHEVS